MPWKARNSLTGAVSFWLNPLGFRRRWREEKATEFAVANSGDYVVSTHERGPGKWQGEIRRRDGGQMQVEGTRKRVFTTALAKSSGEAMELAYQAIDSNEISLAGWI
jgi:nitrogen fixation protein FixH